MANSFFDLSTLNGKNGFIIYGLYPGDELGDALRGAGDINGDGLNDLLIGSDNADANGINSTGISYLILGSSTGFPASFNLSELNGSNGSAINGINERDFSGIAVSSAGDVNGDGIDDLLIGAAGADPDRKERAGSTYLLLGSRGGVAASFNLSDLNGGNGFTINGLNSGDWSGSAVGGAADINGDGLADIFIGASQADPDGKRNAGSAYVIFGSPASPAVNFNLGGLDGSNGFTVKGLAAGDNLGASVSSAGDINGDGLQDLLVGAHQADVGGSQDVGSAYVIFGSPSGWEANFNLAELNGSNGFTINGLGAGDNFGRRLSQAGDINGDGVDDLIVGARRADPEGRQDAGSAYVIFGRSQGWGASFNLAELDGSNGFALNGINPADAAGSSVSGAGDINGDGLDDLIIGARQSDPEGRQDAGSAYIIFGRREGWAASLDLGKLNGSNGFAVQGISAADELGFAVSGLGDINGDGIDDLSIGSPFTDVNGSSDAGATYVILGNAPPELDLNGSWAGINYRATFAGTPTAIVSPLNLTLTDANSPMLKGATVQIANLLDGAAEVLTADTANTAIVASYDSTAGTLTLSGEDTVANYRQALRQVRYNNGSALPNPTTRTIRFEVDDGGGHSNTSAIATTTVVFTFNEILGTFNPELLVGTGGNDRLMGGQGRDTLTGGSGFDLFVYQSLADGGDTISDFEVGRDRIDLTELFAHLGYGGKNPYQDGYLRLIDKNDGIGTIVRIDPDGRDGPNTFSSFLLVDGVSASQLLNSDNFIV